MFYFVSAGYAVCSFTLGQVVTANLNHQVHFQYNDSLGCTFDKWISSWVSYFQIKLVYARVTVKKYFDAWKLNLQNKWKVIP